MALMQITIIPMGTGTPSVGEYVADVQELLDARGADYILNDMGTEIHAETAELMHLACDIHESPFQRGAERVITQIVIDDRRDKKQGIGDKKDAVLTILKEKRS